MIQSIQISKLRGILEGSLEGLTPLTVLVGPNSSGKSTVLDAILIGASPVPADAVMRAVTHRTKVINGARWLVWRGGDDGPARVRVVANDSRAGGRSCELVVSRRAEHLDDQTHLTLSVSNGPSTARANIRFAPGSNDGLVIFNEGVDQIRLRSLSEVRLLEPWSIQVVQSLVALYSDARKQGRGDAVLDGVRAVVPACRAIEVLTESGVPLLHLDRGDRSLQLGVEGDGVQSLVRLALEVASRRGGIVLLEEPETHQHPATLVTTAKVIVAAVQRDIQVVLATHSLELIDALVAALGSDESELAKLSVVSLRLDDGRLISSRLDGPSVARARDNIAMELR